MKITGLEKTIESLSAVLEELKIKAQASEKEISVHAEKMLNAEIQIKKIEEGIASTKATISELEKTIKGLEILSKGVGTVSVVEEVTEDHTEIEVPAEEDYKSDLLGRPLGQPPIQQPTRATYEPAMIKHMSNPKYNKVLASKEAENDKINSTGAVSSVKEE